MKDTKVRSIVKGISWRFIASITTAIVVFIFTGNRLLSLGIGSVDAIVKIIIYYFHERAWNVLNWGKSKK